MLNTTLKNELRVYDSNSVAYNFFLDVNVEKKQPSLLEFVKKRGGVFPRHGLSFLATYELESGVLSYKGVCETVFSFNFEDEGIDLESSFAIKVKNPPYSDHEGWVTFLVNLEAEFHQWREALLVLEDPETKECRLSLVCDHCGFMTDQMFKRALVNNPELIKNLGIKGIYPILATKFHDCDLCEQPNKGA